MASQRELVRRLLTDPFVAIRIVWETPEVPVGLLEEQLARQYESRDAGDDRWRGTMPHFWVFTYTMTLTDEGQVHVTRELPGWVRVVILGALLLAPVLLLTDPATLTLGGLALVLSIQGGIKYDDPPIESCTSIVTDTMHPLTKGLVLAVLPGMVALVLQGFPSAFGLMVLAPVVVTLAVMWYIENGVPGRDGQPQGSRQVLKIPLGMAITLFQTSFWFFLVALSAGVVTFIADQAAAAAAAASTQVEQSVVADYTGGATTAAGARHKMLTLFGSFMPLFIGMHLVVFLFWIQDAAETRDRLANTRLQPFVSGRQRLLAAGLLCGLNLTLIGTAVVGLCVVAYGLTGTLYRPVFILGEMTQLLPQNLQFPTRELVNGLYQALGYNLRWLPGLSARAWSTVAVGLLLWPVFIIALATVLEVVGRPYRALAALARSTRLTAAEGQHLLADDIQIRRVDLDGAPDAKPMTLLNGWRQYVFVSTVLVEKLETDELEAILRHEEYHLQEPDRSLVAECLSPLVGGKNALLAFYDYRASERAADDHAAAHTTWTTTHDAVKETYKLAATADDVAGQIKTRHPGIVQREQMREVLDGHPDAGRLRRLLWRPVAMMSATYELYFGTVLLETAHLDPEERLARLRERAEQ